MSVVIISIVCFVVAYAISMAFICKQDYKCPGCGSIIRPKWHHISAWLHNGSDRVIKCPHCGRKGFCRRVD